MPMKCYVPRRLWPWAHQCCRPWSSDPRTRGDCWPKESASARLIETCVGHSRAYRHDVDALPVLWDAVLPNVNVLPTCQIPNCLDTGQAIDDIRASGPQDRDLLQEGNLRTVLIQEFASRVEELSARVRVSCCMLASEKGGRGLPHRRGRCP